jgi:hypothetical protein
MMGLGNCGCLEGMRTHVFKLKFFFRWCVQHKVRLREALHVLELPNGCLQIAIH